MVYNPYGSRKRKTSTTLPQIQDDDDLDKRVKSNAASRVLESTPTVMPTGNQSAPSIAAQDTIIDSAPKQAALQKALPGFGSGGIFDSGGIVQPEVTRQPAPPPGFDMGLASHANLKSPASGKGKATGGKAVEDSWAADEGGAAQDYIDKWRGYGLDPDTGRAIWPHSPRTPADLKYPEGYDPANLGGGGGGGEEDSDFGAALEKILNDITNQDPTEIARDEAGKAILAARSAAGRGQAGLSGAMLGLQSDIMGNAVKRAEDSVYDRQLEAAKTGVKFENMNTAQKIAIMEWVTAARDSGVSEEEIATFLGETLGMDAAAFGVATGDIVSPVVDDDEIGEYDYDYQRRGEEYPVFYQDWVEILDSGVVDNNQMYIYDAGFWVGTSHFSEALVMSPEFLDEWTNGTGLVNFYHIGTQEIGNVVHDAYISSTPGHSGDVILIPQ